MDKKCSSGTVHEKEKTLKTKCHKLGEFLFNRIRANSRQLPYSRGLIDALHIFVVLLMLHQIDKWQPFVHKIHVLRLIRALHQCNICRMAAIFMWFMKQRQRIDDDGFDEIPG